MGRRSVWGELASRAHIVFRLDPRLPEATGGAAYWPRGGRAALIVDKKLGQRERKAAVAHELVHDERGGACCADGMPATWDDVVVREERHVEREVAHWLVPADQLVAFIERRASAELEGVTVWEVADAFDVPDYVAERALRELGRRNPDGWEST